MLLVPQATLAVLLGSRCWAASTLRDVPIASGVDGYYLDGTWTVKDTASLSIPGAVPGDLVTDLQIAGKIADPLYELGFKGNLWDTGNYTYSLAFTVPAAIASVSGVWLVFDGVKMAADISLNGQHLGAITNQFVRTKFDVSTSIMKSGTNSLSVTFTTMKDPRNNEGRFMGCSGGWDWGPYTVLTTAEASKVFTKGIWKSVYLLAVPSAAIEHVAPLIYYNGAYPTAPLTDAGAGPWTVSVRTYISTASSSGTSGSLTLTGGWAPGSPITVPVTIPAGPNATTVIANITVPVGAVSLWWPNGMGKQTLYPLNVTFTPSAGTAVTTSRRVGFRSFVLVTGEQTTSLSYTRVFNVSVFTPLLLFPSTLSYTRVFNESVFTPLSLFPSTLAQH